MSDEQKKEEKVEEKTYEQMMKMTRDPLVKYAGSFENFSFDCKGKTKDEIANALLEHWGKPTAKRSKSGYVVKSEIKEDGVRFLPGEDYTGNNARKFLEDGQIRRKEK